MKAHSLPKAHSLSRSHSLASQDPRPLVIERRLSQVQRILAVTGGKGGIGKSMVASTLALILGEMGPRIGLLDLDFTGPCDHTILGIEGAFPEEHFGLVPPEVHGLRFMSIAYFVGADPAPLRGADLSNALIELLSITQWGTLDVLVMDMPPGLGDATLDAVRLMDRAEFLVVATRSRVVLDTVRRTLRLLTELQADLLGVVENMGRDKGSAVEDLAAEFGVPFLGVLPFDETLEDALGDPHRLRNTAFAVALSNVSKTHLTSK